MISFQSETNRLKEEAKNQLEALKLKYEKDMKTADEHWRNELSALEDSLRQGYELECQTLRDQLEADKQNELESLRSVS